MCYELHQAGPQRAEHLLSTLAAAAVWAVVNRSVRGWWVMLYSCWLPFFPRPQEPVSGVCALQDLPAVAVAGINRITTRALARRQQGQPAAAQQQQRQHPARRHRRQQQQQDEQQQDGSDRDGVGDGDAVAGGDLDSDDDAASSGSSSEVDSIRSRTPPVRRRTLRARRTERAEVSPA